MSDKVSPPLQTVPVLIKFCGITTVEDAREAAGLGAAYLGVILAESPRRVSISMAATIFAAAGRDIERVAVFGSGSTNDRASVASELNADVIQLHGAMNARKVEMIRRAFPGKIWAVVGLGPDESVIPDIVTDLAKVADGVLLDTFVAGKTGGTGVPLAWERLADAVSALRERTRVILAGGLNPENVAAAVGALRPDVVDVSSGVERSPGKKDHFRMRAFAEAARSASIDRGRIASSSSLET